MENDFLDELLNMQTILKGLLAALILLRCLIILSNARSNEQPISAAIEQCKKVIFSGVIAIFIPDYIEIISSTGFFTGAGTANSLKLQIIKLLKKSTEVITSLATILTVINVIKELISMSMAKDENKIIHQEKVKKILLIGIITICASGILTAIFGYFEVPVYSI